jgi:hypothetical protein
LTYRDLAMAIRSEVTMLKRAASARCLTPPVTRGVGADPDFVDVSTWRWKARFCVHRTRLRSVPIESRQHQGKGFFVSNTNGIGQRRSRLSRLSLGGGMIVSVAKELPPPGVTRRFWKTSMGEGGNR